MSYVKYEHHNTEVWVREDLKGHHRNYCACYSCTLFKPNDPDNCKKAQELYELCVRNGMTTPVFECSSMIPYK